MSRASAGSNAIVIRPTNNVYTALLAVAVLLELIAFLSVMLQYNSLFAKSLFQQ
jgi:hypothetical protein